MMFLFWFAVVLSIESGCYAQTGCLGIQEYPTIKALKGVNS